MNINKPQIHAAGSAVSAIQGQPGAIDLSQKVSSFPDKGQFAGNSLATAGAYQADE